MTRLNSITDQINTGASISITHRVHQQFSKHQQNSNKELLYIMQQQIIFLQHLHFVHNKLTATSIFT